MRGDVHVRFGGRAEETDRGTISAPRLGPTRHLCVDMGGLGSIPLQCSMSSLAGTWHGRADHLRTELVTGALDMALFVRRPQDGLVLHSD